MRAPREINFVFLLLTENPIGRQMLVRFLASGYKPSLIVQETSKMAARKKVAYQQFMQSKPLPPLVSNIAKEYHIPIEEVENHNENRCRSMVSDIQPDLILLGNTRVLKSELFSLASDGCISVHPGLLPMVRGAFPVAWSIYYNQKVGCTSLTSRLIVRKNIIKYYIEEFSL